MKKRDRQIYYNLVEFLSNNGMHSTIVGKTVTFGSGPEKNMKSAKDLAGYIVDMIEKADKMYNKNVKKTGKHVR